MPYKIIWETSGVVLRYSGRVSDEEIIASNDDVYASPLLPSMKYQILDFSLIESFDVASATVRQIAESDRRAAETNPNVKTAIFGSHALMRGLSNMYALIHEAVGGTWAVKIFDHEKEARAWAVPTR